MNSESKAWAKVLLLLVRHFAWLGMLFSTIYHVKIFNYPFNIFKCIKNMVNYVFDPYFLHRILI